MYLTDKIADAILIYHGIYIYSTFTVRVDLAGLSWPRKSPKEFAESSLPLLHNLLYFL